nr:MAG TPA: hypothetical protein [Caudoviricetes sp.]
MWGGRYEIVFISISLRALAQFSRYTFYILSYIPLIYNF